MIRLASSNEVPTHTLIAVLFVQRYYHYFVIIFPNLRFAARQAVRFLAKLTISNEQ